MQPHPLVVTVTVYDTSARECVEEERFSVALLGDGAGPRQGELEVARQVALMADRYRARVETVQEQAGPDVEEPRYPVSTVLNRMHPGSVGAHGEAQEA